MRLKVDIEVREGARGTTYWARARWHDPLNGRRVGVKRSHPTNDAAEAWIERMQSAARTGLDEGQTLATYLANIGDRWTRAIDPTSTYDPYAAGLKRRVLPALGHLPVTMITAGLVDRAIDEWEQHYGTLRQCSGPPGHAATCCATSASWMRAASSTTRSGHRSARSSCVCDRPHRLGLGPDHRGDVSLCLNHCDAALFWCPNDKDVET